MTTTKAVPFYSLDGKEAGEIVLPAVFATPYRPDVIKRAVLSSRTARRVRYGRHTMAGKQNTAESYGVGRGMSRVPRIKGSRHPAGGRGAQIPFAVGGRLTHPPRAERKFHERINRKERHLAVRSAIAATANPALIEFRGHIIDDLPNVPVVVTEEIEQVAQAKAARSVLRDLGMWADVEKAQRRMRKVRPGKGKHRGRRHKGAKSILIVIDKDRGAKQAFRNFPGVDIVETNELNAELLAPGTHAGRLTIWSNSAIESLTRRETEENTT